MCISAELSLCCLDQGIMIRSGTAAQLGVNPVNQDARQHAALAAAPRLRNTPVLHQPLQLMPQMPCQARRRFSRRSGAATAASRPRPRAVAVAVAVVAVPADHVCMVVAAVTRLVRACGRQASGKARAPGGRMEGAVRAVCLGASAGDNGRDASSKLMRAHHGAGAATGAQARAATAAAPDGVRRKILRMRMRIACLAAVPATNGRQSALGARTRVRNEGERAVPAHALGRAGQTEGKGGGGAWGGQGAGCAACGAAQSVTSVASDGLHGATRQPGPVCGGGAGRGRGKKGVRRRWRHEWKQDSRRRGGGLFEGKAGQ